GWCGVGGALRRLAQSIRGGSRPPSESVRDWNERRKRRTGSDQRRGMWVTWPRAAWALVAVVLSYAGIGQWVYTTFVAPLNVPPSLSLLATIDDVGSRDDLQAVKLTVAIHNTSKQRVKVLTAWFNLDRVTVDPVTVDAPSAYQTAVAQN